MRTRRDDNKLIRHNEKTVLKLQRMEKEKMAAEELASKRLNQGIAIGMGFGIASVFLIEYALRVYFGF